MNTLTFTNHQSGMRHPHQKELFYAATISYNHSPLNIKLFQFFLALDITFKRRSCSVRLRRTTCNHRTNTSTTINVSNKHQYIVITIRIMAMALIPRIN
jgi:hypothetical protein